MPSRVWRSSALAPVSAKATGNPTACTADAGAKPQKYRECDAQYPYSAQLAKSERWAVSRERPHSTGVESTTHTSSVDREHDPTRYAHTTRVISAAARTRLL
jgi:hypothetical protein